MELKVNDPGWDTKKKALGLKHIVQQVYACASVMACPELSPVSRLPLF